jgi:hypothetical protein
VKKAVRCAKNKKAKRGKCVTVKSKKKVRHERGKSHGSKK